MLVERVWKEVLLLCLGKPGLLLSLQVGRAEAAEAQSAVATTVENFIFVVERGGRRQRLCVDFGRCMNECRLCDGCC